MQPALLVNPTLVTEITFLTLRRVIEIVRSRARLGGQVLSMQSDNSSSNEPWLEGVEAPSPILKNQSHREEPAAMSSSKEPAKKHESEGDVYTRSGKQVKSVRKDGMYYY